MGSLADWSGLYFANFCLSKYSIGHFIFTEPAGIDVRLKSDEEKGWSNFMIYSLS